MDILIESLTSEWQALVRLLPRLLVALIVFAGSIFIGGLISKGVMKILSRGDFKPTHGNFFRGLIKWIVAIFGLIVGLNILGLKGLATSLVAGGGITAIVLGFAFREIGSHRGDVIDLRIFQFTLMEIGNWIDADQSTGRVIKIPNGKVFTEMLANYSKGFRYIWNEVPVLITFESNWKRAKEILDEIVKRHAEHLTERAAKRVKEASAKMMVFYTTLTRAVYTSVKDCGVLLTVRYLCKPRDRRGTEHEIWEDILVSFSECDDIDFAYPTVRRYSNQQEGKPRARAKIPSMPSDKQTNTED